MNNLQQIQEIKNKARKEFENKRAELLVQVDIEKSFIPEGFKEILHKCLMHTSLLNSRAGASIWHGMVLFDRDFKFPEVTLMIDIIKATSPNELGQTLEENLDMLVNFIIPFERQMNEIDWNLSSKIQQEISVKYKTVSGVSISTNLFEA